jgi:hypothetical protein
MIVNPFVAFGAGGSGDSSYGNVKLLLDLDGTNGSTTYTDFSSSPATMTGAGGASISTTRSVYGGASLFLDGINGRVNSNRQIAIGANAFTLEAHIRPTGAQTGRIVSAQNSTTTNAVFSFRADSTGALSLTLRNSAGGGTVTLTTATGLIAMNDTVFPHVAVTRDGSGRIDIWINGTSVANTTSTTNPDLAGNTYMIGSQYASAEWFKGYIDNLRLTEGVCRYTSTFTPPAAAYPHSL